MEKVMKILLLLIGFACGLAFNYNIRIDQLDIMKKLYQCEKSLPRDQQCIIDVRKP
jgi:hypothetical protein